MAAAEFAARDIAALYKKRAYNGIQDGPVLAQNGTELLPAEPGIADEDVYLTQWFYMPIQVEDQEAFNALSDEEKAATLKELALPMLADAYLTEEGAEYALGAKDYDVASDFSGLWVRNPLFGMDTYTGEFKEQIPKLKGYCPLGRLGTESEISAAVCFLLSDASAYMTGTELRIDGGVPLANRSVELPATDRSKPFNGFHLAKTPKVLGG